MAFGEFDDNPESPGKGVTSFQGKIGVVDRQGDRRIFSSSLCSLAEVSFASPEILAPFASPVSTHLSKTNDAFFAELL